MKKKIKTGLIILAVFVGLATLSVLAVQLTSPYLDHTPQQTKTNCPVGRPNHKVVIQNNIVTPAHIDARQCDTLTINNLDDAKRLIAFGQHEKHVAYDGITQKVLTKNKSFTVMLITLGDYKFHDHMHDEIQGTFKVEAQN